MCECFNYRYYDSKTVFSKFDKIMQCSTAHAGYYGSETVDLDTDPYMWQRAASCNFPGASVFRMTQQHADTIKRVNDYLYDVTIHKAWLTEFNVRHNLTSPYRVDEGLQVSKLARDELNVCVIIGFLLIFFLLISF